MNSLFTLQTQFRIIGIACILFLSSCTILRESSYSRPAQESPTYSYPTATYDADNRIQIALILDTSNSMDGLLEQAKAEFWYMIDEFIALYGTDHVPILEIALIEYGNKYIGPENGFMRIVTPLTTDLDWIADELYNLRSRGNREYCGQAIDLAVNNLEWSPYPEDLKLIFIAGNESFTRGPVPYYRAIEQAVYKGIQIHTIFCGDYNEGVRLSWERAALMGQGSYSAIDPYADLAWYQSDYDALICELNIGLNQTYIPYGSRGSWYQQRQYRLDRYSDNYGRSSQCIRTIVKGSPFYYNANWDLVDAYYGGRIDIRQIPDSDWPRQLRRLSYEERIDYISRKKRERDIIMKKIRDLRGQRRSQIRLRATHEDNQKSLGRTIFNSTKETSWRQNTGRNRQISTDRTGSGRQTNRNRTIGRRPESQRDSRQVQTTPPVERKTRQIEENRKRQIEQRRTEEARQRAEQAIIEAEERKAEQDRIRREQQETRQRAEQQRREAEARQAEQERIRREQQETRQRAEQQRREAEARQAEQERIRREQQETRQRAEQQRREAEARQAEQERIRREQQETRQRAEQQRREAEARQAEQERIRREQQETRQRAEQQRREAEARQAEQERIRREQQETRQRAEQQRREAEARQAEQERIRREQQETRQRAEQQRREAEARQAEQERKQREIQQKRSRNAVIKRN